MNILCIGNSYGVDAGRYLHQIARKEGVKLNVAVLFYPGCALDRHYRYMIGEGKDYELYYNGFGTGFFVSMKEALLSQNWDVITMQQASLHSTKPDSYDPYAESIAAYVRECCPKAKLIVHQTWAYEEGSDRLTKLAGYPTSAAMFADVEKAYEKMVATVDADGVIPSGKMMQLLHRNGIEKLHRDTFHATKGLGRYALGLLWYRVLTGNSVAQNSFRDFDEPVEEKDIAVATAVVEGFAPII